MVLLTDVVGSYKPAHPRVWDEFDTAVLVLLQPPQHFIDGTGTQAESRTCVQGSIPVLRESAAGTTAVEAPLLAPESSLRCLPAAGCCFNAVALAVGVRFARSVMLYPAHPGGTFRHMGVQSERCWWKHWRPAWSISPPDLCTEGTICLRICPHTAWIHLSEFPGSRASSEHGRS